MIDKEGAPEICERIEVVFGAHPVPDENYVRGCRRVAQVMQIEKGVPTGKLNMIRNHLDQLTGERASSVCCSLLARSAFAAAGSTAMSF